MPEIFMVSQVLLWIAVIVLTTLVLALARQVGVLHERIAPAGALAMNAVLKVGEKAPHLIEQSLDGRRVEIGKEKSVSTLVFFLSPDCPVCNTLLPALKSALKRKNPGLNVCWPPMVPFPKSIRISSKNMTLKPGPMWSRKIWVSNSVSPSFPMPHWWTRRALYARSAWSIAGSIWRAYLWPKKPV